MDKWSSEVITRMWKLHGDGNSEYEIAEILTSEFPFVYTRNAVKNKRAREEENGKKPPPTSTTLYDLLKNAKEPLNIEVVCQKLRIEFNQFEKMVDELRSKGYNVRWMDGAIELPKRLPEQNHVSIDIKSLYNGKLYQFGIISDVHMGSRYCREDVLESAYNIFQKEGVRMVYLPGNIIDGYSARINPFDLLPGLNGYTAQVEYLIKNFPQRKGVTTNFITGDDHEGWWVKDAGINIGEYIQLKAEQAGRHDLQWIGHMEVDVELKNKLTSCVMRIVHPGGGTAYAVSYSTQKIIESYQGGEKPAILVVGHFHKHLYQYERNVHVIQAGCIEDQTPFMRKKKLAAHIGFWIIRFHQATTGEINRFQAEWFPFFDKGFYKNKDHYKMW